MFIYPHINPIALQLGPLAIHWYGLMYAIGFLGGWALALLRARKPGSGWTKDEVSDLIFYAALGVIIGGRVGYMLFYNLPAFLAQPWIIFKIWQGGMAFHGGLMGVLIAVWFYQRKTDRPYMAIVDFVAPLVPIGLGAGRIGNFINGELWGRVTTVPWGMIYPNADPLARHPSELYEFLLEGVLLFIILWCYSAKAKPRMAVSGMFALCYGLLRIFAECFREPDPQIGFLFGGWLTQGQLLSIPLVIAGVTLLALAYRKPQHG